MKARIEEAYQILNNSLLLALLDEYEAALIATWVSGEGNNPAIHAKVRGVREIKQYITNKAKEIYGTGDGQ